MGREFSPNASLYRVGRRLPVRDSGSFVRLFVLPERGINGNEERLDGENGFLLTPDVDLLFDRGFISFEDTGKVLVSPVADLQTFERMGIAPSMLKSVGAFSEGQRKYLNFHRESIFLEAKVKQPGVGQKQ